MTRDAVDASRASRSPAHRLYGLRGPRGGAFSNGSISSIARAAAPSIEFGEFVVALDKAADRVGADVTRRSKSSARAGQSDCKDQA